MKNIGSGRRRRTNYTYDEWDDVTEMTLGMGGGPPSCGGLALAWRA